MDPRSSRRLLSAAGLAALGACLSQTAHYRPDRDDAAMAAISGAFAEGGAGGVVLSLCEDVAASEGWTPGCQEQHVVQGGGRGLAHDEDVGGLGCGGCPFVVVAHVVGTVEGGSFAQPAPVRGTVRLQSGRDDDPYAFPYSLELDCEGAVACRLHGTLGAAGGLALTVEPAAAAGPALATYALTRQGAATCP